MRSTPARAARLARDLAGRCAVPNGIRTRNVVPSPGSLVASIVAAVQLHELLHEREADAGAFVRAALRAFDAVEALEQPRQLVLRHADAGVRDLEQRRVAVARAARTATLPVERELERVREQVEDDLLPHLAIDETRLAERLAVDRERRDPPSPSPTGTCSRGRA